MDMETPFNHHIICGKDIYIVDDHHQALLPWAMIRRRLDRAPNLITIDHHTDINAAFEEHVHLESDKSGGDACTLASELAQHIDWQSDQSLFWAMTSISMLQLCLAFSTMPSVSS